MVIVNQFSFETEAHNRHVKYVARERSEISTWLIKIAKHLSTVFL